MYTSLPVTLYKHSQEIKTTFYYKYKCNG